MAPSDVWRAVLSAALPQPGGGELRRGVRPASRHYKTPYKTQSLLGKLLNDFNVNLRNGGFHLIGRETPDMVITMSPILRFSTRLWPRLVRISVPRQ